MQLLERLRKREATESEQRAEAERQHNAHLDDVRVALVAAVQGERHDESIIEGHVKSSEHLQRSLDAAEAAIEHAHIQADIDERQREIATGIDEERAIRATLTDGGAKPVETGPLATQVTQALKRWRDGGEWADRNAWRKLQRESEDYADRIGYLVRQRETLQREVERLTARRDGLDYAADPNSKNQAPANFQIPLS